MARSRDGTEPPWDSEEPLTSCSPLMASMMADRPPVHTATRSITAEGVACEVQAACPVTVGSDHKSRLAIKVADQGEATCLPHRRTCLAVSATGCR